MNVASFLDTDTPDERVALLTSRASYTYGDIRRGTAQVANLLLSHGAQKGDRVVLIAEASYFWVVAYLGTIRAGCVSVPLPVTVAPEECAYILDTTACKVGFLQGRYGKDYVPLFDQDATLIATEVKRIPEPLAERVLSFDQAIAGQESRFEPVDVDDRQDLASLMFTSGSTGRSRGVMVSHRNIIANTSSIIEYLELTAADRIMAVLPFYYCFGTSLLHTHLRVGGSVVISTTFAYPNQIWKRMQETRCTGFAGVPSTYQIALRRSSFREMEFPHLRYVQQAGGKLPDVFIEELREALPHVRIFVMYGQTEATARLSYLPPEMLDIRLSSIGKGIPGTTLQVLNEQGEPVSGDEVGEIVAQGDNITLGYWNAPEETAKSFRDGKLYTGDLATVDEEGYIFIKDRAKDFLKCGGNRVSCREIESKVLRFPGLVEAAVIGQPDEVLGEAVRLYVVHPDGEGKRDELEAFCQQALPRYALPKAILFRRDMPKNSSGKLDKRALKDEFEKQGDKGAAG